MRRRGRIARKLDRQRRGEHMAHERTTGPARCCSIISNSVSRAMQCREPVRWHGMLASAVKRPYWGIRV